jgi:hypothetical protein
MTCAECDTLAPHPHVVDPEQWIADIPGAATYLTRAKVACSDPAASRVAELIGHAAFQRQFNAPINSQPNSGRTERQEYIHRCYVAWVVEQIESGRLGQLLNGSRPNR